MEWATGDLKQRLDSLREDRFAWQIQLEEAVSAELRALGLLDAARAAQERARDHVRDDSAEIDALLDEMPKAGE